MSRYAYSAADSAVVIDTDTGVCIPVDGGGWQGDAFREWLAAGNIPDPAPNPTTNDLIAQYTVAVQAWLDKTAQGNGYDSLATCISYGDSSVAQWAADALAARHWRDAVWQAGFAWAAAAQTALPSPLPTVEQFIAELPQPETSGWVVHAPGASSATAAG